MPIRHQEGNFTVRELDGLLHVEIKSFIASIQATLMKGQNLEIPHKAVIVPKEIHDIEDAHKWAIDEAMRVWSKAEGYENHSAFVETSVLTFERALTPPPE